MIGITGLAGSGKDTACEIILYHGIADKRYAYADPLKACVNSLFDWNDLHSYGELKEIETKIHIPSLEDKYPTFMNIVESYELDTFGLSSKAILQEWLFRLDLLFYDDKMNHYVISPRQAYQHFGTELCRNMLDENIWVILSNKQKDKICISDVRFPNECEGLINNGHDVIRINRKSAKPVNIHESESYIKTMKITAEYDNDGSLYDLESWILDYFNITPKKRMYNDNV